MSADKHNERQLLNGELLPEHVTELVEHWQRHHKLTVDGYAGPNTIDSLERAIHGDVVVQRFWPLRDLADGRHPIITSGFKTENPSRPKHDGADMFYRWLDTDPEVAVGNGGAIKRNGKRRWWYPDDALIVAAADGEVQVAGKIGTGFRLWVEHADGLRTGYFHAKELLVDVGDAVEAGEPIAIPGDNPKGHDAKHLHFEVSPVDHYAPMNPRLWLQRASYLPAV